MVFNIIDIGSSPILLVYKAWVAQSVEHLTVNQKVIGSIPILSV